LSFGPSGRLPVEDDWIVSNKQKNHNYFDVKGFRPNINNNANENQAYSTQFPIQARPRFSAGATPGSRQRTLERRA
jgi:hypothetical protein